MIMAETLEKVTVLGYIKEKHMWEINDAGILYWTTFMFKALS